jgi:hypothetical protein
MDEEAGEQGAWERIGRIGGRGRIGRILLFSKSPFIFPCLPQRKVVLADY